MILAWASPFKQILVIFTHLKLWVAVARHNFKWEEFKLDNVAGKALISLIKIM